MLIFTPFLLRHRVLRNLIFSYSSGCPSEYFYDGVHVLVYWLNVMEKLGCTNMGLTNLNSPIFLMWTLPNISMTSIPRSRLNPYNLLSLTRTSILIESQLSMSISMLVTTWLLRTFLSVNRRSTSFFPWMTTGYVHKWMGTTWIHEGGMFHPINMYIDYGSIWQCCIYILEEDEVGADALPSDQFHGQSCGRCSDSWHL